ncbi:protein ABHD11-like isoform X2 [Zootermopsis nevadensis]|uniref:protein ABHD11-like isoform X2 n=1 Tax=Zootermopsis nevadensis TaxID=136037 RepID=UPI000B8E28C2|nr:protein ABHD11-like isoform X2 [Zootermopsis nevadensis]
MLKKGIFTDMAVKFVSLKTNPHVTRLMASREQVVSAHVLGSGGSVTEGNSVQPVKMAYTSYESTKPSPMSTGCPVIIMHGLLGSKGNWNAMSKMLHSKTNRKPELVEKLVIVDISPVTISSNLSTMPRYFEAMMSVQIDDNVPLSKARKVADEQLAKYVLDSGTRQFLLTNLVEAERGHFKWRINLDSIIHNFNNIAAFSHIGMSCPVPTLFIAGANSDYIRSEDHDEIKRLFPAAEFETVPGAGHWVHADKPNELLGIIKEFIQNTEKIEKDI